MTERAKNVDTKQTTSPNINGEQNETSRTAAGWKHQQSRKQQIVDVNNNAVSLRAMVVETISLALLYHRSTFRKHYYVG